MSLRGLVNILALACLCIAVYAVTATLRKNSTQPTSDTFELQRARNIDIEKMADGTPAVRDARGALVPIRSYERIIAASITSSEIIQALIEDTRVVAYSQYASPAYTWKYAAKPRLERVQDVESVLALDPDIVFYNGPIAAEPLARLNEHGVQTFDLGFVRGLDSYLTEVEAILTIVDNMERFENYRYTVERRAQSVICKDIDTRQDAMYVGLIASTLFGGTTGTSYHDVIELAGLRDAAADTFDGWPQYSTEDLLAVNPTWVIVPENNGKVLCELSALDNLDACADNRAGIIEIPDALLQGPGTAIITSASMVFDRVYGPCDYAPEP